MAAASEKGGRHVMAIDGQLVDGVEGYTGAQYINAAYRVPARVGVNKAEMKDGGTIRVMKGKVIHAGEEVLMAYHSDYWRRWRPADVRPRGRPRKQPCVDAEAAAAAAAGAGCSSEGDTSAACGHETVEEQRGTDAVVYMAESGGVRGTCRGGSSCLSAARRGACAGTTPR